MVLWSTRIGKIADFQRNLLTTSIHLNLWKEEAESSGWDMVRCSFASRAKCFGWFLDSVIQTVSFASCSSIGMVMLISIRKVCELLWSIFLAILSWIMFLETTWTTWSTRRTSIITSKTLYHEKLGTHQYVCFHQLQSYYLVEGSVCMWLSSMRQFIHLTINLLTRPTWNHSWDIHVQKHAKNRILTHQWLSFRVDCIRLWDR